MFISLVPVLTLCGQCLRFYDPTFSLSLGSGHLSVCLGPRSDGPELIEGRYEE